MGYRGIVWDTGVMTAIVLRVVRVTCLLRKEYRGIARDIGVMLTTVVFFPLCGRHACFGIPRNHMGWDTGD